VGIEDKIRELNKENERDANGFVRCENYSCGFLGVDKRCSRKANRKIKRNGHQFFYCGIHGKQVGRFGFEVEVIKPIRTIRTDKPLKGGE